MGGIRQSPYLIDDVTHQIWGLAIESMVERLPGGPNRFICPP